MQNLLSSANALKAICHRLLAEKPSIQYIAFHRCTGKQPCLCLTTQAQWLHYLYQTPSLLLSPLPWPIEIPFTEFAIWSKTKQADFYQHALKRFHIQHGITLCKPYQEIYDLFRFGTINNILIMDQCYVDDLFYFQVFIHDFLTAANPLITTAPKITVPAKTDLFTTALKPNNSCNTNTQKTIQQPKDRYPLSKSKHHHPYLTKKQAECAIWVTRKENYKAIAKQLNISVRTISSHMEQVREKLGCKSNQQIARQLINAGLWSMLDSHFPENSDNSA